MAIREICPGCTAFRNGQTDVDLQLHSCNIKLLPVFSQGALMVYEYIPGKKIFFLYHTYAPGLFIKSIDGSCSTYLIHGKHAENIFNYHVSRLANEFEKKQYKELVEKSKYASDDVKILTHRI